MAEFLDNTGLSRLWGKIKAALNSKQDTLVSGTNLKTINGNSLLGSGNITTPNTNTWRGVTVFGQSFSSNPSAELKTFSLIEGSNISVQATSDDPSYMNFTVSATDTKPNSWKAAGVTDITGTDYSAYNQDGGVSLASGSAKSVGTINLTAGVWVVEFTVSFTANSTGYRSIGLSGTKNDSSYGGVPNRVTTWNAGTQATVLSKTILLYPSTTTRYHILAGHNVGSAIIVYPRTRAIKIT